MYGKGFAKLNPTTQHNTITTDNTMHTLAGLAGIIYTAVVYARKRYLQYRKEKCRRKYR